MRYLPLLWASLWRKPIRSVLTVLSIAVAFLLFGLLHGVISAFDGTISKLGDTRLRVMNRANILAAMPISYEARIASVPGVRKTVHITVFVGYYQDRKNGVSIAALDVDSFLDALPQLRVPADQRAAMRRTRTGALVGYELAKRFNWHIGDRITLHSALWVDEHGSSDWPVDIVGFCNAGPDDDRQFANEVYMNYEYLDSARATGKGTVHQFIASIDDPAHASDIAIAIDRMFANSSYETQTLNEKEWITNALRQTGDVRFFVDAIIGAVMFTLLFLAGNTMAQSVRDRLAELGLLKALGFRDGTVALLVVLESTALALVGATLGLAASALTFPTVFGSLGAFGPTPLPLEVHVAGLGIALLMAILSAAIPALEARRLTVAEALAGH